MKPQAVAPLSAAVREVWDAWYAREIGAAETDAEELTRVRAWRTRAEQGFTLTEDGLEAQIGRPARAVHGKALATELPASAEELTRRKRLLVGVLVGLVIVVLFGVWGLVGGRLGRGAKSTATPVGTTELTEGQAPELVEVGGAQRWTLDTPRSVTFGGRAYQVVLGQVKPSGAVVYPAFGPGLVVWFPSGANWLVGAEPAAVEALQVGDVIVARTRAAAGTGRVVRFVVDAVQDSAPQAVEALGQQRAGLTLFALAGPGPLVRVVTAVYDPTGEVVESAETAEPALALGTVVTVTAGVTVQVTGTQVLTRAVTEDTLVVFGTATGAPPALWLDLGGQRYAAQHVGVPDAHILATFVVPRLAPVARAELVVGAARVALGVLALPTLKGTVQDVRLTESTLDVLIVLTATQGTVALGPQDVVLLGDGAESKPVQVVPTDVTVQAGTHVTVWVEFARPRLARSVRLRVLDAVWEIAGLVP